MMVKTVLGIYKILKLKMVYENYENLSKVSLYFPCHSVLYKFQQQYYSSLTFFYGRRGNINNLKHLLKIIRLQDKYLLYSHLFHGGTGIDLFLNVQMSPQCHTNYYLNVYKSHFNT